MNDIEAVEKRIKEVIEERTQKLAEKTAFTIFDIATNLYSEGYAALNPEQGREMATFYLANNDVRVEIPKKTVDGYVVTATGKDAVFLEFGTGVGTVTTADDMVMSSDVPISPGSYSATAGSGEFAEKGYWHYGGVKLTGSKPLLAMYSASSYARQYVPSWAKEIFEK